MVLGTPTMDPGHATTDLLLTNRPSGAVGAEGDGTGLSVGGKGGGGPPTGQAPRPPCAAAFAARDGGRGRRRQPGSVAVWTGARLCLWRARPHPVATLAEATAQHGLYGVIPIRYVAVEKPGLTYAFGLFPIALKYGSAR